MKAEQEGGHATTLEQKVTNPFFGLSAQRNRFVVKTDQSHAYDHPIAD